MLTRTLSPVLTCGAPYAPPTPSPVLIYGAPYAISGTDGRSLRPPYAISGTEIAYGPRACLSRGTSTPSTAGVA
eukprot:3751242-Rhodomonas_salina.7